MFGSDCLLLLVLVGSASFLFVYVESDFSTESGCFVESDFSMNMLLLQNLISHQNLIFCLVWDLQLLATSQGNGTHIPWIGHGLG